MVFKYGTFFKIYIKFIFRQKITGSMSMWESGKTGKFTFLTLLMFGGFLCAENLITWFAYGNKFRAVRIVNIKYANDHYSVFMIIQNAFWLVYINYKIKKSFNTPQKQANWHNPFEMEASTFRNIFKYLLKRNEKKRTVSRTNENCNWIFLPPTQRGK